MSNKVTNSVASLIFLSRWLQAPMYLGLIVALGVYAYKFFVMLAKLIINVGSAEETDILLSAHGRIDNLNYLYLLRPGLTDNDWKVYHVKNKNVGYLPSELYKNSKNVKHIVKRVKSLL